MALSLLDCAESDRPLPIPVPVRSFGLVDSVYTITEADTTLYVPVRRSCGCGSAWVWAACSTGTATAGEDYVAATALLEFERGSAVESLAIHFLNDSASEDTEFVRITLGMASGSYEVSETDTAIVRIVDDDTTPAGPHVAFTQLRYFAFEGQDCVRIPVTCTGCACQADWVILHARTADGTAIAGTDYAAQSDDLWLNLTHTVTLFSVQLFDNHEIDAAREFTVQLHDPPEGIWVDPPAEVTVEILDDDTPVESPTIRMPLELGNEWAFDATAWYQSEANYDGVLRSSATVGTLCQRVHFQGEEYLCLKFTPTSPVSGPELLLRQSGDSLLGVCPADTVGGSFLPPWQAALRESLPWLLARLSAVSDTTLTLFSAGDPDWGSERRVLRVLGRQDTVVPAGQFRRTLRVRYERDLYHPQLMTSLSSSIEFTLADSIGIVQAGWGEFSTMGGLWTMRSWSAELVSCLLSR